MEIQIPLQLYKNPMTKNQNPSILKTHNMKKPSVNNNYKDLRYVVYVLDKSSTHILHRRPFPN